MEEQSGKLTVFFEDPFWVGVFERISDGKLSVCKVTFGAEPKDYEIYAFVLQNHGRLKFSPAVEAEVKKKKPQPETDTERDTKAGAEYRYRYESTAGLEAAAGADENGAKNRKPKAAGGGKTTPF